MKMEMRVELTDKDPVDVTSNTADMIALEEKYGISGSDLEHTQKVVWLAYLVWHALRRTGGPTAVGNLPFDEWKQRIELIEPAKQPEDDDSPDAEDRTGYGEPDLTRDGDPSGQLDDAEGNGAGRPASGSLG